MLLLPSTAVAADPTPEAEGGLHSYRRLLRIIYLLLMHSMSKQRRSTLPSWRWTRCCASRAPPTWTPSRWAVQPIACLFDGLKCMRELWRCAVPLLRRHHPCRTRTIPWSRPAPCPRLLWPDPHAPLPRTSALQIIKKPGGTIKVRHTCGGVLQHKQLAAEPPAVWHMPLSNQVVFKAVGLHACF